MSMPVCPICYCQDNTSTNPMIAVCDWTNMQGDQHPAHRNCLREGRITKCLYMDGNPIPETRLYSSGEILINQVWDNVAFPAIFPFMLSPPICIGYELITGRSFIDLLPTDRKDLFKKTVLIWSGFCATATFLHARFF